MASRPPRVVEEGVSIQNEQSSDAAAMGESQMSPEEKLLREDWSKELSSVDVPMIASQFDFVQAERDRLRRSEFDTMEISDPADPRLQCRWNIPFPKMDEVTTLRLSLFKELWHTRHQTVIAAIPHGTGLNIDLGSGMYVTGRTRIEASDKFRAIFGPVRTSLAEEIGIPLSLGSGLWALQSEE